MIDLVTLAEERLSKDRKKLRPAPRCRRTPRRVAEIAPILRGAVALERDAMAADGEAADPVSSAPSPAILDYVNGAELARYASRAS